jgi:inner membrane protein
MASIFGHIVASTALGKAFFPKTTSPATLLLCAFCAAAPDLDVLAFHFGIPYGSPWGHRGWTHSLLFAGVFGCLMGLIFNALQTKQRRAGMALCAWCVLSTLSHPLLDMLTDGGRGCALWWPFSVERIFFPQRPIVVSPLGAEAFFSTWGMEVLRSELCWIGLPALALVGVSALCRWLRACLKFY